MDEQGQHVVQHELTDMKVAKRWADEVRVAPNELPALEEFVELWRREAIALASCLGAGRRVNFLRIVPIRQFDVPDTSGMSDDEALDALYDARDATEKVTNYRLEVVPMTTERVADVVAKTPGIHARTRALTEAREERRQRRVRRPRRRGAGRPSHRRRARANAPPSDDDGEPEPDPVARRSRRAVCCWGARR